MKVAEHPSFAPLNDPAPAHLEHRVVGARWFGFDVPIPRARRRKGTGKRIGKARSDRTMATHLG